MKTLLVGAIALSLLVSCSKSDTTTPTPVTPKPVTPTITAYIPDGWKSLTSFTSQRVCATAVANGDKLYAGLGYDGPSTYNSSVSNDWYEYDPATAKWTQKASFPGVGRANAVGFALNGKIYVGLGTNYDGTSKADTYVDFYEYDPTTGKWTAKTDFPEGNARARGFDFGTVGMVAGGRNSSNAVSNTVYQYNPADNTWTNKGGLASDDDTKKGRFYPIALALKSKTYIGLGGYAAGQKDFYEYVPK